jgi:DNA-binding beta-propeller fold protein YncE
MSEKSTKQWGTHLGALLVVNLAAVLLLFLDGCGLATSNGICSNSPQGIYFNDDGTAYVASLPPWFSEVVLWKVNLAERRVLDMWLERTDPLPIDRTILDLWDQAAREYYVAASWRNNAIADGLDRKEITTPGGTRYVFSSYGGVFRVEMMRDEVKRVLLDEVPNTEVTYYEGMVTMVAPEKLYVMVNKAKYTPSRPIGKGTEGRGALLYVVEADSGEIKKRLTLWPDVGVGRHGLAQGPDGLVYAYNSWTNIILVIDPQRDEIVGEITLCK